MPSPLELTTISAAGPLVRRGSLTSAALVRACLDRIEAANGELRAFITVLADSAMADAERADREIAAGRWRGPLHGIPISIKDLIDIAGVTTTAASRVREHAPPATADAPVIAALRTAGAVLVGKTNLHEFAFGTTSEDSAYGAVRNPLDPARSAGGSSGGSAASIVAGMCLASIGTDTGGSIRIPSAACGLVGLKPTFGEISCAGVVPLAPSLDHVGPLARTVADAALVYHAIGGETVGAPPSRTVLKLAIPSGPLTDRLADDVREAFDESIDRLRSAGCTVTTVDIPHASIAPDAYLLISLSEAAEYHAPTLSSGADLYTPAVRVRIELGSYVLAEDYLRARRTARRLQVEVDRALAGHDALILPTLPITAPTLGDTSVLVGSAREPIRAAMLRQTQLFNMTGHPAVTLPNGRGRDGLPTSLQFVGARGGTGRLLAVAQACEPYLASGSGSVGGGTAGFGAGTSSSTSSGRGAASGSTGA